MKRQGDAKKPLQGSCPQVYLYLCLLVFAFSCVEPLRLEEKETGAALVNTSFALSLNLSSTISATKMSGTIVQNDGNFRGIEQLYVVPFQIGEGRAVVADDMRLGGRNVDLRSSGIGSTELIATNNAHLYDNVSIPRLMNRVLVYGQAVDMAVSGESEKTTMRRNGVLQPSNLNTLSKAEDISFRLAPILDEDETSAVQWMVESMIDALNGVVDAIRGTGEPSFAAIFNYAENQILACSYPTFYSILDNVQTAIFGYHGQGAEEIVSAIDDLADILNQAGNTFPASYGIPEGSLGFWWNGREFRQLITGVNIDIVPLDSYCYPPSLWYYTNSPVRTSKDASVLARYTPAYEWTDILDQYTDGDVVLSSTRSTAIDYPLQYGVAMMELVLAGSNAPEANGCPLTGILVGGQKDVDFAFLPTESDRHHVYDIVDNGPTIGAINAVSVRTLLLQTPDGSPVRIALEFRNNTGNVLHCQQGDILPDCKFYLVGELDPARSLSNDTGDDVNCTFCQDHKTTVNVQVKGLGSAYNTIPDLDAPQLEVGIEAEMKWVQNTPQSVKLNL